MSKGDFNDFTFKLKGHKHGFQAPTKAERDGWLVAIDTKSNEANAIRESIVGSEGYKSQFEQLSEWNNSMSRTMLTRPIAKPSALATTPSAAAATSSRSASRPKKSLDGGKVHDGTTTSDNVAIGSTSSDEDKTGGKGKSRSQSRKRGSIFGALLGKKEEHDEKKEVKKEEKTDDKVIKQEIKAIKQEVKEEDKAEKKAEKEDDKIIRQEIEAIKKEVENEDKTEKENLGKTKDGNIIEPGPLDTAAVGKLCANMISGDPLTSVTVSRVLGESAEGKTESKGLEQSAVHSSREAHPKPTKRNSIFGSLFGKKETANPVAKESATTTAAKDSEPTAVSATAPRLDDPITTGSSEPSTTAPVSIPAADTNESSALVDAPSAQATTPDPAKEKRRSSFFGTLGTRKEKRSDVTSDTDITDGEGKKSTFGGLFRKPSRAATGGNRSSNNATSTTPAVVEPTESPTLASKDDPAAVAGDTGFTSEPVPTGPTQHTPVSATA